MLVFLLHILLQPSSAALALLLSAGLALVVGKVTEGAVLAILATALRIEVASLALTCEM